MGRSAKLDEQPTPEPMEKIHSRLVELFPNRDQQTQCREFEWVDTTAYEEMLLDPLALIRRQNGEIGCTRNKRATPDDCKSVTRRLAHGEDTGNAQSANPTFAFGGKPLVKKALHSIFFPLHQEPQSSGLPAGRPSQFRGPGRQQPASPQVSLACGVYAPCRLWSAD